MPGVVSRSPTIIWMSSLMLRSTPASPFLRSSSPLKRRGSAVPRISAIRNHAQEVSDLLGLPEHVFPIAGLGLGWPAATPASAYACRWRVRVHRNRFDEAGNREAGRRLRSSPPRRPAHQGPAQRGKVRQAEFYGWSEDKVRQYATPERADWGAFVRAKGFRLD